LIEFELVTYGLFAGNMHWMIGWIIWANPWGYFNLKDTRVGGPLICARDRCMLPLHIFAMDILHFWYSSGRVVKLLLDSSMNIIFLMISFDYVFLVLESLGPSLFFNPFSLSLDLQGMWDIYVCLFLHDGMVSDYYDGCHGEQCLLFVDFLDFFLNILFKFVVPNLWFNRNLEVASRCSGYLFLHCRHSCNLEAHANIDNYIWFHSYIS